MRVVLKNLDSSFLPLLESLKNVMPNLEIIKDDLYDDNRDFEDIKVKMDKNLKSYKEGDLTEFKTLSEVKDLNKKRLVKLGAKI